ncbi:hypothetical protein CF326_g4563 [Tilletia indica]|nr:hypothetical protein CF326_g4563 [Tilletia indica]
MAPSSQQQTVAVPHPPSAAGFAAWEHANGNARPHTADALFGPADPNGSSAVAPNGTPAATGRPSLSTNYSSGSSRVFAYMPTSNSDEFASPGYGSFDSSYSPYQPPDTASTSNVTQNGTATASGGRGSITSVSGSVSNTEGTASTTQIQTGAHNNKKRPRRRYDEIERMYPCNWPGCAKSYGTLNHLNAHVAMQKHGTKRLPHEFKEMRKQWRKAKRDDDQRRAPPRVTSNGPGSGPHFAPSISMGNGSQQHLQPPDSSGGVSTGTAADDPYLRGGRFDSFSSAPGGYAGEAGGSGGSYYGGGGPMAHPPFYPPGSAAGYNSAGPRGSTSSAYSYATAPPGMSGAGGSHQHHYGSGTAGSGHWVTPYNAAPSSASGPQGQGQGTGHMFPPPPGAGPGRSYSMSSAATNHVGADSSSATGSGTAGAWSTGHSYTSAPPRPYTGGGAPGGYAAQHPAPTYGGHAYGGASGYGGYGGATGAGAGAGSGGMSAPSTSAGPPSSALSGSGMVSNAAGQSGSNSSTAVTAAGGLGAYLMAHRGSI